MNALSAGEKAFKLLNGVVCVYKPTGVALKGCRHSLLLKLCQDLNALGSRSVEKRVVISGDTTKELQVKLEPNYADDVLVVGPRYQQDDFKCIWTTHLGMRTSGVCVLGLNKGTRMARNMQYNYPMRTYHLHGQLGIMTKNMHIDSEVVEKGRFDFVRRENFDKLMSTIQASNQKKMFQLAQLDTQTQTAYEVATRGLIRPTSSKDPLIYGIKCISLELPNFIVEVNVINEYEDYLLSLVHEIGLKLRSSATCTAIRCIRYSSFTINQALLMKHWNLEFVLDNIKECNSTYNKMKKLPSFLTDQSYFENNKNAISAH